MTRYSSSWSNTRKFGGWGVENQLEAAIMNAATLLSFLSVFSHSPSLYLVLFFLARAGEFCQASCWKFNHPPKSARWLCRDTWRAPRLFSHSPLAREREREEGDPKRGFLNKTYGVSNKFARKGPRLNRLGFWLSDTYIAVDDGHGWFYEWTSLALELARGVKIWNKKENWFDRYILRKIFFLSL